MIRWALALALWPVSILAAPCEDVRWEGYRFTTCTFDPAAQTLRLFLYDPSGAPYGHFSLIDEALAASGQRLGFAMNAGMYHEDRAPVGHYVEDGVEVMRVIPNAGPGNFGLLPNGVFCIGDGTAHVIETLRYLDEAPECTHATQSGPMLVIGGALHPRFLEDGTSRYIRNGVGTSAEGDRVVFAISNNAVNFHTFGRFFADYLELPQALYFDGNVSRLHAPENGRSDPGFRMGPIVGIVEPLN